MKSTFFIGAAFSAGLVAAQNLTGEPDCAVPCLSSAIASVCTPASDQGCACASQGAIGQAALSCLLSSCNGTALGQAQSAGAQLCVDYSATATGVASTSAPSSSSNSTAPITTGSSTTGSGATATSARMTTSGSSTRSSTATSSSASATSSAGANGMNGVVAAQAGLLGALLAGVAALL